MSTTSIGRTGEVRGGVPYEEWVRDALGRLTGGEFEDIAEAEDELLSFLRPMPEGHPSGLRGVPGYVVGDVDPSGRAEILVHDLYAAAWCLPLGWAAGEPPEGRPEIYEDSDGERYASVVGAWGPPHYRRAAFEERLELRSLACASPADLRALHGAISLVVGEPLSGRALAGASAVAGEELRIFVGLDTFSHAPSDPLSGVAVFPLRYPQVFSDGLDDEEPEVEVVDDEGMTAYAEIHYDFWNIRIFGADGSYRVLPEDPGANAGEGG